MNLTIQALDSCNVYGGDNSTCVCNTTTVEFWITYAIAVVFSPVMTFIIMKLFVFIDNNIPGYGISSQEDLGEFDKDVVKNFQWLTILWTVLLSVAVISIFTGRIVLALILDDTLICPNMNYFIWHAWAFWLFPLGICGIIVTVKHCLRPVMELHNIHA